LTPGRRSRRRTKSYDDISIDVEENEDGYQNTKALFGCTEMIFGIELGGNSKFGPERKWLTIQILLFGCFESAVGIT
jgi:hypothetical protein